MGNKVLVVDDNPGILKLLKIRLEFHDCEVVLAMNGNEGVRKAKDELPDVILMDISMPGMDGAESVRALREDFKTRDIPIIFVTNRC